MVDYRYKATDGILKTNQIQVIDMDARSKPTWQELPEEIRNEWIQQTQAFYPIGSTTIAEVTELAQYEYDQSESESLRPMVEPMPDGYSD